MRETISNERGTSMIEGAIALPVFLIVLLFSFDLFWISYHALTFQFIAQEGVRAINLMQPTTGGSMDSADRALEAKNTMIEKGDVFLVDLNSSDIAICSQETIDTDCTSGGSNAGEPLELVAVRVEKDISSLFVGATYNISGLALGRNEP